MIENVGKISCLGRGLRMLRVDNPSPCGSKATSSVAEATDVASGTTLTVKSGCVNINPGSKRGKRVYLCQMLVLLFIPIAALIVQNCIVMATVASNYYAADVIQDQVSPTQFPGK